MPFCQPCPSLCRGQHLTGTGSGSGLQHRPGDSAGGPGRLWEGPGGTKGGPGGAESASRPWERPFCGVFVGSGELNVWKGFRTAGGCVIFLLVYSQGCSFECWIYDWGHSVLFCCCNFICGIYLVEFYSISICSCVT